MDTGMFPTAEESRQPVKLFPPSLSDETQQFIGWTRTITFLTQWPFVYRIHEFPPMKGQDPVKTQDGRILVRDRKQRAVCLGSPQKPFDGSYELELNPDGCEICGSIKLPDGSSLHDAPIEQTNRGNRIEWHYIFPVYVWEEQCPYVVDSAWTDKFVKALLAERAAHATENVNAFAVCIEGYMDGRAKAYKTAVIAPPGPHPQADPTSQRWLDVQRVAVPYYTPEAIVKHLGITRYNPQYAPNAQPTAPSSFFGQGPVGDTDDPFATPGEVAPEDEQV
jgi:hypothetical protein